MTIFPYTIYRGDTVTIDFTVTEDDTAFNLTGSTVKFTGKNDLSDDDTDAVFDVTCTLTNPTSGQCSAEIQVTSSEMLYVELEYRKDSTIKSLKQWKMFITQDVRLGS